jgi:hypothetical protein
MSHRQQVSIATGSHSLRSANDSESTLPRSARHFGERMCRFARDAVGERLSRRFLAIGERAGGLLCLARRRDVAQRAGVCGLPPACHVTSIPGAAFGGHWFLGQAHAYPSIWRGRHLELIDDRCARSVSRLSPTGTPSRAGSHRRRVLGRLPHLRGEIETVYAVPHRSGRCQTPDPGRVVCRAQTVVLVK